MKKVYAPFDWRNHRAQCGCWRGLVNADANTAGKELFHLASNSTLARVCQRTPKFYSRAARTRRESFLNGLGSFRGASFHGTVGAQRPKPSTVNSRDAAGGSRRFKNPTGELLPGSYGDGASQAAFESAGGHGSIEHRCCFAREGLRHWRGPEWKKPS